MIPPWVDIAVALLVTIGATFALIGAYGLATLGDFLKRVHGPAKASTLGVGCVLIASMLYFTCLTRGISAHELLVMFFIFLTAPVSAHLLVRVALKRPAGIRPPPLPSVPPH